MQSLYPDQMPLQRLAPEASLHGPLRPCRRARVSADNRSPRPLPKAMELQTLDSELEGLPVGDERTRLVKAQREIKTWFEAQLQVIDAKFSPFLQMKD